MANHQGPPDLNEIAARVVAQATSDAPEAREPDVALAEAGRKGARKRSETLTAERRSEIARKAAQARWNREGAS